MTKKGPRALGRLDRRFLTMARRRASQSRGRIRGGGVVVSSRPDGTAVETDNFYGTHINAPDFTKVAEAFGAHGEQVTDPDALEDALRRGLEAVSGGRAAILDVVVG